MKEERKVEKKDKNLGKKDDKQDNKTQKQHNSIKGITVIDCDRESLLEGQWVTCTIISVFMTLCEEAAEEELRKHKVSLVRPEQAQIFKFADRVTVDELKEVVKMNESEWVFFPVTDRIDEMDGDGGSH